MNFSLWSSEQGHADVPSHTPEARQVNTNFHHFFFFFIFYCIRSLLLILLLNSFGPAKKRKAPDD